MLSHQVPAQSHGHNLVNPGGVYNIIPTDSGTGGARAPALDTDDTGSSWSGGNTYYIESTTIPAQNTGGASYFTSPGVSVSVSNSTNANNAFSILNPCIALNYIIKF
jgi:transcription elongation factor